jgi:hypothetical protein
VCPGDLAVLEPDKPTTETHGFRAGSYGGYNTWRERLCRFALDVEPNDVWTDPKAFAGQAFVELINFSDAERSIGPVTSAKLAADFAAHYKRVAARAITLGDEEVDFIDRYEHWRRAFELASADGFVVLVTPEGERTLRATFDEPLELVVAARQLATALDAAMGSLRCGVRAIASAAVASALLHDQCEPTRSAWRWLTNSRSRIC